MVDTNGGEHRFAPAFPILLEVNGVTFGYERQPLLYDIHLQVRSGEMVGLLGPNGSGKTTLLRLVNGVLSPQQGTIIFDGHDLHDWGRRSIAQNIAVVPQELQVPFAFTVEQMVSLGRTPYINWLGSGSSTDENVVRDAMQVTDVVPLAKRIFNELSGGERQRVMVAMALAQQPKLLLLDEPTAHLDIKYQIDVLELVQRLNRERGVTIIAALHDLNLAARYFPRLVLFQRGIVADAGPAVVLEPHLLKRVYGIDVQVGILRGAQHLSVLPPGELEFANKSEMRTQPKVFVMAGGGSGERLMRALADAQIPFVAGALNIGDSDHTLALRLADEVITEQPYSPISPATREAIKTRLLNVKVLIVCPMPVGPGNLALLQEAYVASQEGKTIILLAPATLQSDSEEQLLSEMPDSANDALSDTGIVNRDYTNGIGTQLIRDLLQAGAIIVQTVAESVEAARRYLNENFT
ncbi:MAG TPA: ABC transporter ATP-binding protein [Ktedonobacteraceae bacterium]|nr:ABC transporter ATP-binding protein [Ktedonobacteraceae bacterium]